MTMNQRARTTGLLLAFILVSATLSASAAPRTPVPDTAQEVDAMRAAMAAAAKKAIETQGESRILFKVDAGALREAVVTDLRDDVVRIVREDRMPVWRCVTVASRCGLRTPTTGNGS
jgi:preprotein translocase subunit SecD